MDFSERPSFGDLLKHYRTLAALTQEELAERAGLSTRAVSDLERGVNRSPRTETLRRIAEALGLATADQAALAAAAPSGHVRTTLDETATPAAHGLPAFLTSFVGRDRERAALQAQLERPDVRLLTLLGPGGVGKTRLAVQVAADVHARFAAGVAVVSLAHITDPSVMIVSVMQAIGLRDHGAELPLERLIGHVRDKELLLVLDNFEQVLAAGPALVHVLSACPRLKLVVTSRALLRLSGECTYVVPPLALPHPRHVPPLDTLSQYAGVQLFVERAQAINADFVLTHENAFAVIQLCHRLDGLPLPIELAAARVRILPPAALLARLTHGLAVLTNGARDQPPRQQTIRATIDWSYRLLQEDEQRLFTRLAVFAGGWTLEAAEAICAHQDDKAGEVLDEMQGLIDQSLVQQVEVDGQPRFHMLETVRDYAEERLAASTETEPWRRHAAYFRDMAEAAEPSARGDEQHAGFTRLEVEHDNLRAALRRSLAFGEADTAARLASALTRFWYAYGHVQEGRRWFAAVLVHRDTLTPANRAKVLREAGWLAWISGDHTAALAPLEEGLTLYRQLGRTADMAFALVYLGSTRASEGCITEARAYIEEGLGHFRQLKDHWGRAIALSLLGYVYSIHGDYHAARPPLEESAALFQKLNDQYGVGFALSQLGIVTASMGAYAAARGALAGGASVGRATGNKAMLAMCLGGLAVMAGARAPAECVARIYAALEALPEDAKLPQAPSAPLLPAAAELHAQTIAAARNQLDDMTFATLWAEGRAMTLEQAVAYALACIE